jgi:hypothetical protein
MKVFWFSWSILDRNNVASAAYRDLGITPVLLSSIPASDASHQIAQETDARFGHGGRMCKRLLSTVAPLTARSKLNERGIAAPELILVSFVLYLIEDKRVGSLQ